MSADSTVEFQVGMPRNYLRPALLLLLVIVPAACSTLPSPSSNMATGEALNDLSTVISQLREENAQMQAQIDSLAPAP